MVAYPDGGEGNDPEPFFFFFFVGGWVVFHNIFTVGNMRVMICLGQGGLRSLSAASFSYGPGVRFYFKTIPVSCSNI